MVRPTQFIKFGGRLTVPITVGTVLPVTGAAVKGRNAIGSPGVPTCEPGT